MKGTSGPSGSGSSESVSLTSYLVNRSRVLLDGRGSILFRLTWKEKATPLGRLIYVLRASVPRISGKGSTSWGSPSARDWKDAGPRFETDQEMQAAAARSRVAGQAHLVGWPTATTNDAKGSDYSYGNGDHDKPCLKLGGAAKLTNWPTPRETDGEKNVRSLKGAEAEAERRGWNNDRGVASLASWATPAAAEAGGTPEAFLERKRKAVANGKQMGVSLTSLSLQAQTSHWATPRAEERQQYNSRPGDNYEALSLQVKGSGPMLPGSLAETVSPGQLNPDFSLWLMGFPAEWVNFAPSATRSSRK